MMDKLDWKALAIMEAIGILGLVLIIIGLAF